MFAQTVNQTSILTQWVEKEAVLGKSAVNVRDAMGRMKERFPFKLLGVDSDNGDEFINKLVWAWCEGHKIIFTRSRAYKKDDQAHIEQKNKTHVRKWVGWLRYDTAEVVEALNDLYRNELRLFENLFMPSVRLIKTVRRGSKTTRVFDKPQTPLDRVVASKQGDSHKVAELVELRKRLDPFELSRVIDIKLKRIYGLASKTSLQAPAPPRPMKNRLRPWSLSTGFKGWGYSREVGRLKKVHGKERMLGTW